MQLSLITSLAIISTLLHSTIAAPTGDQKIEIKDNGNGTSEAEIPGSSKGVEFPFSEDAIIEAIALGDDIAPIVLSDAVYFVNATKANQELDEKLSKRDAEAWFWRPPRPPQY